MSEYLQPEIESPGQEIADILSTYGEEHGFDAQTCDEIAAMEFSEAFETAYSYLASAGLDSEVVLKSFMEPPQDED